MLSFRYCLADADDASSRKLAPEAVGKCQRPWLTLHWNERLLAQVTAPERPTRKSPSSSNLNSTLYSFRANERGIDRKSYHHLRGQKLLMGHSERRILLNLWLQHLVKSLIPATIDVAETSYKDYETFAPRGQWYDAVHQVPGRSHLEADDHRSCQRVPRMPIDDRRLS